MSDKLPALTPDEMIMALKKAGFIIVRQTGGHIILHKNGLLRPIPVPKHPGNLKRSLQNKIIREAGLTNEEFKTYL
jgi:predicted RNA binding protein YcfA (HicA-like mRNA interferase family)